RDVAAVDEGIPSFDFTRNRLWRVGWVEGAERPRPTRLCVSQPAWSSVAPLPRPPYAGRLSRRRQRQVARVVRPPARAVLQQAGDQRRPAGLVARPQAAAGVAVKVFMEEHVIAPVGFVHPAAFVTVARPAAAWAGG